MFLDERVPPRQQDENRTGPRRGGIHWIAPLRGTPLCRGYRVTALDNLLFGGNSLLGYLTHPGFSFHKKIERVLGDKARIGVEEGIKEMAEAIGSGLLSDMGVVLKNAASGD